MTGEANGKVITVRGLTTRFGAEVVLDGLDLEEPQAAEAEVVRVGFPMRHGAGYVRCALLRPARIGTPCCKLLMN